MVNSEHLSSDGEPVKLVLDEKKNISGSSIWVFDIYVTTEQGDMKANYQMGVDSESSYVYTVYEIMVCIHWMKSYIRKFNCINNV